MEITRMGTMNRIVLAGALSFAMLAPMQVWAWGPIGHQTVADIAYQGLLPATKKRVDALLGGKSLVSVASWADSVRPQQQWNYTAYYHFEKIDEGKNYIENLKNLPEQQQDLGSVVMAILQAEKVFTSKNSTEADKINVLKFIVHFVGDIHQPLHTGRPEDKGGNLIPRVWNGFQTNLHAIWDSSIIETGHGDIFSAEKTADAKEKLYTRFLQNKFKNTNLTDQQLNDLNLWVDESLAVRPDAYTYMDEDSDSYTNRFLDIVDSRIYLAGVRLAAMLNQMVIKEQPASVRAQFMNAVEKVAGSLGKIISFQPHTTPGDQGCQVNCSL